ncbi:ABC-F family ATP-binding cassette domain-containing protein [Alistipes putredinis]|uniref:ABC-F family ATP-binding cassette domain-containing protein n=3 Tax=Alistipes putredinis TaxID=28117 RepID=UPI003AEFFBA3
MINYLQVENLTKSYGDLVLFDNISFTIGEGQRIALIGRNGSGKTTLLNILAGKDTADSGTITPRRDLRIAYLEQNPEYAADLTVLEACFRSDNPALRAIAAYEQAVADPAQDGLQEAMSRMDALAAWDYEQRAKEILSRLKINDFDKKIGQLSGGQLKRVALAAVLISEADLLILDEPTNHLDTDMTEWLEEYLTRNKAALLMVTHDRYFLDRVCSDILEVAQRSVCLYKGNYAYYVEKKQERAEAAEARRESDLNLYRRELEWMRRQPQARATKARARIDSFHELDARLKSTRTQASLKLDVQATRIGTKIFEAKELCKRFGDLVILDRFNYNFARYDKLGIVGDNGCGKSTFLKLLTGIIQPDSGTIEVGESVRFGYYSQQGLDFDEGKRVIDIVTDIAHEIHLGDGRRMSASQFLQYFLFPPEVQYSYVARLSGGERKRLYLCTILIQSPNFLILDEPTNDLDIVTLGVLEEYLQAFKGCVIVVSHDRYFVDKVADHLLVFCGGGEIREFAGTYSDYTAWKRDYEAAKQAAVAQEKAKSTASGSRGGEIRKSGTAPAKTGAARKLTFQEKREMEHLEAEIPELEQEKAAIEEKLSSGDLPFEELTALSERITALMDQIDTKSMRWLELSEIGG